MAKGRPRKKGKREKSGRPSRAGVPRFDRGTERAQAMTEFYGTDGCDAIGRAYRHGLLGSGQEAKNLLDTGRKVAKAYWQAYETGKIGCTLGERTGGSVVNLDHERIKRREDWLTESLGIVSSLGARRVFDQLVIDINPDSGPDWLDRLCDADRTDERQNLTDISKLRQAVYALQAVAG